MPEHQATFSHPGPALNPLMLVVAAPVTIELFQPKPDGKWAAREKSGQRPIKEVQNSPTVYSVRYNVARLFQKQLTPWSVAGTPDPNADRVHLHYDPPPSPSLCGSAYHLGLPDDDPRMPKHRMFLLSAIRSGAVAPPAGHEIAMLCPACCSLVDRRPHAGDVCRVRVSGKPGTVIGPDPKQAQNSGAAPRFLIESECVTLSLASIEVQVTGLASLPDIHYTPFG
jgi:hypothetical protein